MHNAVGIPVLQGGEDVKDGKVSNQAGDPDLILPDWGTQGR